MKINSWKTPEDWSSIDLESRKKWYLNVGNAYERTRPSYDPQLIERIIESTGLTPNSQVLELGCGTGKATIELAKLHIPLLCLEPNPEFLQIAQENCLTYSHIQFELTSFEEWQPQGHSFDAIIAANSFHWLSPDVSYPKSHQLLKEQGYLILIWNLSLQLPLEIYQQIKHIYQKIAPHLDKFETLEQQEIVIKNFGKMISDSQLFNHIITEKRVCKVTYSIDDYLTLLSTYSPYIALSSQQRSRLFSELKDQLFSLTDGTLFLSYLSAAHIAQKK